MKNFASWASFLCLIHCTLLPLVLIFLPTTALYLMLDSKIEFNESILEASSFKFAHFSDVEGEQLAAKGQELLFDFVQNLSTPVIAAVNGFALGGGLELAMACHFRVASDNAKMGLPEVTLGLIPGYGGTQRLPKLVGKGIANEMIFSAKMIPAQKAKEIGLVNEVFPIGELVSKTEELAKTIANNSPMAISRAIKATNLSDTDKGFETEIKYFGELFEMEDKKEGVTAFLEKRKPNF